MNKLTYEENYEIFKNEFWAGDSSIPGTDKIKLICLFCYLTQKLREKNKDTKVIQVIEKVILDYPKGDNYYRRFLWSISYICEAMLDERVENNKMFPTFGLTTPKDVVDEMRRILSLYLPF